MAFEDEEYPFPLSSLSSLIENNDLFVEVFAHLSLIEKRDVAAIMKLNSTLPLMLVTCY